MRNLLVAVVAATLSGLLAVAWAASPAHGHTLLTASTPADGANVEPPPTEVLLTFNEPPDPVLSVVHVLDASGTEVEAGEAEAVAGQPGQLRVALGVLAPGSYTVAWRVTSAADGHTTSGSVAFGVGVPVAATNRAPAAMSTPAPSGVSIAGRWLFYVGVVLLLGAAVIGLVVVSDPAAIAGGLVASAWAAAASGLVLTVADHRASARTTLGQLFSSPTGGKLAAQAVAVALAGVAVAWAWRRPSRSALVAVGLGASGAMLARALAGHANASSVRWFTVGVQWLHLVSVGAWIGGLAWLLVAVRRGDRGRGPGLARRFSSVATGAVAVVAVSGTLRAVDEVGGWTRLVDTGFGETLLLKVGLFAALVALGALGRLRHVPSASAERVGGLRRIVRAEVVIGAGVLAVTAVLAGLPPPASVASASRSRPDPAVAVTGHDDATSVRVRLVVTPGSAGANRFEAAVSDERSREPVPAESVSLRFQLLDRPDVSPATLELARDPDARWRGSGTVLSTAGRWRVTALVETATVAVEVPMQLPVGGAGASTMDGGPCGQGTPDRAYTVAVDPDPDPPRAGGTAFHLTVRRDGRPVTGASVCMKADMPDMQHRGVNTVATEPSPGTYVADLDFVMPGTWEASVTIAEPGRRPVSVPTSFEVEE